MDLPPDPYVALGVPKDATQATVKTAHRKLALKCHPDKVADPEAKQAASDQFHKIQTAYEILVDEDRRARYDAQVRLAGLKKERAERKGGSGSRGYEQRSEPSPYRSSQENVPRSSYGYWDAERVTPQYEERKPYFATPDYFDAPPRASTRKEPENERTARRSTHDSPKQQKERTSTRDAKDVERERRREKTRRAERDTQRDRDRKYTTYAEEGSESNSDEHDRSRRTRGEDEAAAARKVRDAYYDQAYKQQRDAKEGRYDDRARKMFAASADAWDHILSSRSRQRPESERRPSPVRQGSSKDQVEYVTRKDGRPAVAVRRPSERPRTTGRDADFRRQASGREMDGRPSAEVAEGETRRPPTLNQTKSSPADIRLPTDKPRAQSVQIESDAPEIPKVKRAETMHALYERQHRAENVAPKSASLRPTEINEGLATPATTPEYTGPSNSNSNKYRYGRQYADDAEYPTPDGYRTNEGYRTEVREPVGNTRPVMSRRYTRSPSPYKETREARETREPRETRETPRTTSARYPSSPPPPSLSNSRKTSYVYTQGQGVEARQNSGRGSSSRDQGPHGLYGEIRQPAESPRAAYGSYAPPEEDVRYQRPIRPENIRIQSGYNYSKRASGDRPSAIRNGSENIYTGVRA